jgi:hypothetical protein
VVAYPLILEGLEDGPVELTGRRLVHAVLLEQLHHHIPTHTGTGAHKRLFLCLCIRIFSMNDFFLLNNESLPYVFVDQNIDIKQIQVKDLNHFSQFRFIIFIFTAINIKLFRLIIYFLIYV